MAKRRKKGSGGARANAGRKPKYAGGNTQQICVHIPPSVVAAIDRLAMDAAISRSAAVTVALQFFIKATKRRKK